MEAGPDLGVSPAGTADLLAAQGPGEMPPFFLDVLAGVASVGHGATPDDDSQGAATVLPNAQTRGES